MSVFFFVSYFSLVKMNVVTVEVYSAVVATVAAIATNTTAAATTIFADRRFRCANVRLQSLVFLYEQS